MSLDELKRQLEELINIYFDQGDSTKFQDKINFIAQQLGIL